MGLCLGIDKELMESLWVRIKKTTDKVDEALYGQIGTASYLQSLVLTGNWRDNTAGHK